MQPGVRLQRVSIHLQIFILSDNITAGADYALGSQAQGLSGLTKAERLKLIFQALDKKDRIIKRMSSERQDLTFYDYFSGKRSRGFRSSGTDVEVKKNPLTGSCVKEVGLGGIKLSIIMFGNVRKKLESVQ